MIDEEAMVEQAKLFQQPKTQDIGTKSTLIFI